MCEGADQLIIPAFGDAHCTVGGVVIYCVLLFWCFLGVALIADIFMAAIETITSKEEAVTQQVQKDVDSDELVEKEFTVKVWNDTVANLTLMALGSSAPEILLSVIEVTTNDFYSGELGPSTIVGSAAFNLFIIIAVCVVALPEGETRRIADMKVFTITAIFSVLAYIWLLIILVAWTPDIITIAEGLITFLLFPVLVCLAYAADAKVLCFSDGERQMTSKLLEVRGPDGQPLDMATLTLLAQTVKDKYGDNMSDAQNAQMMAHEAHKQRKRSRAYYRVQATRNMTGGKKIKDGVKDPEVEVVEQSQEMKTLGPYITFESQDGVCVNEWEDEDKTTVSVTLVRSDMEGSATVALYSQVPQTGGPPQVPQTGGPPVESGNVVLTMQENNLIKSKEEQDNMSDCIEGNNAAEEGMVFVQKVTFESNNEKATISFDLSDELAKNKQFSLWLKDPSVGYKLDSHSSVLCNISNDRDGFPGMLAFDQDTYTCSEDCGNAKITVVRKQGSHGKITCKYSTKDGTAHEESDYTKTEGELVFEHGETSQTIEIPIVDDAEYELTEHFFVELTEATEGVMFDPTQDGHADKSILKIYITDNDELRTWVDGLMPYLEFDRDALALGQEEYCQQFCDALKVNGGEEDEDEEEAGCMDWTLHIFSVPWKLLFAIVPPCRMCGGWLTFSIALMMIGGLTAIIGDLATLMGDAMGLEASVTAITFVALGTSLPDTFASKKAATDDATADAAIGNVTGSNAVNVFLGLGMPWLIAAIYWENPSDSDKVKWLLKYCGSNPSEVDSALSACPDVGFAVPAGSLGISVGVFSAAATICLLHLVWRRSYYGAELGGPNAGRYLTAAFLISLWAIYIGVSIWQAYK